MTMPKIAAAIREEAPINSSVKRRSLLIGSHKTGISLEDDFWACVRQIARERATTAAKLIGILDAGRNGGNLSSAIHAFVLDHYRNNAASTSLRGREGFIGGAERPKAGTASPI